MKEYAAVIDPRYCAAEHSGSLPREHDTAIPTKPVSARARARALSGVLLAFIMGAGCASQRNHVSGKSWIQQAEQQQQHQPGLSFNDPNLAPW